MGAQQHPAPPPGLTNTSASRTILVADDSATIRKIVELTFAATSIHVDAVANGNEALERLRSGNHDLVLADVAMPGPSGYELCRLIKTSARPVPVLLLTGAFETFDEERAREAGADGHVGKPFETETLIERVGELLAARAEDALAGRPAAPGASPALEAGPLPQALLEQVVRAVLDRLSERVLRDFAREALPAIAERVVRDRIRELERMGGHGADEPCGERGTTE